MYNKVAKDLNFPAREKEIAQLWKDKDIVRRSFHFRDGAKRLTFFDGPPTANGRPHIGHIETRVIKDLIPRYWTMKGYSVLRKAGWDTHGLPVELEVEKTLGLDGKPQIEQYGIEPFIKECKKSVWKYLHDWEVMSDQVGYWVDMEHPYITYENDYIESEWWSLKEIWKKGLLYQGHKIVPYCPRCGTALSSHEVAQGYKTVKETSAYVRFPVKGEENTYLLAWTTTPWTLPSNMALCVNPTDIYCRFKAEDGRVYIMAKALMETVFPEQSFEVLAEMPGTALKGMEYVPLFDFAVGKLEKVHVFGNDYPTPDGTGVRDYIHVVDLARGHVAAIKKLEQKPGLFICNLGTGHGYSVLDVINAFSKACGKEIPYVIDPRRPGDIAECWCDPSKAKRELGWEAQYGIEEMCAHSWNWQSHNPDGYKTAE